MSDRPFIILGGGGHGRVVASTLREIGATILGYTDPAPRGFTKMKADHLGDDSALDDQSPSKVYLAVGIGSTADTTRRNRLFNELKEKGFVFPTIVHPNAVVASDASLGPGAQVMAGAVVQTGTTLAKNVIVNTGASVDHDCSIQAHAHVGPGATLSGGVTVCRGGHIGTGATAIQNVKIGNGSTVGAGAVVIEDVPTNTTVVGTPARKVSP